MIYEMTTYLLYSLTAGLCLLVFSVFLSISLMVVKSGWQAAATRDSGEKKSEGYEPLRKDGQ